MVKQPWLDRSSCDRLLSRAQRVGCGGGDVPLAIVTGASRGLGAAYARQLAARGWDLVLVARDQLRLEEVASDLTGQHRTQVMTRVLDLSMPDAAHGLYAAARERGAAVDLLVNNAGFGLYGDFVDLPMARIQAMLRVHVNTVVESMRLFLPGMIERRAGGIINVASLAGFFAVPYMAEYAATKAFLITFSQAVAEEVRPFGVRIQACCPGKTLTDFHATAGQETRNVLGTRTAEEVARQSLAALERGPVVLAVGWQEKTVSRLTRLVPRGVLARFTARWMRKHRTEISGQGELRQRRRG